MGCRAPVRCCLQPKRGGGIARGGDAHNGTRGRGVGAITHTDGEVRSRRPAALSAERGAAATALLLLVAPPQAEAPGHGSPRDARRRIILYGPTTLHRAVSARRRPRPRAWRAPAPWPLGRVRLWPAPRAAHVIVKMRRFQFPLLSVYPLSIIVSQNHTTPKLRGLKARFRTFSTLHSPAAARESFPRTTRAETS